MQAFLKTTISQLGQSQKEVILQFTFQDESQFYAWELELAQLKQSSERGYSDYFLNLDGSLRYQDMFNVINQAIVSGSMSLIECLEQYEPRSRLDLPRP